MAALVASTAGTTGCECRDSYRVATEQTVTVQVLRDEVPVMGVEVTAWIIDVDATTDRAPIVAGTAMTSGDGVVEFTYLARNQPYVCGYEVREAGTSSPLARSAASVSNHLSNPSGVVTVALP